MDFKKIYKRGLGVSFLLLIFIIGVLFIPNLNKKQVSDGNSISTSGPDDAYEPNNIPSLAYNLTMWEDFWLGGISGLGILQDDDYYVIDVKMGFEHLQINLNFTHSLGDINIDVQNASAAVINGGVSITDNEYIDFNVPSPGIYYIRVFGPNSSNTYNLWWKSFPMDDAYEENDYDWEAFNLSSWPASWLPFGLGVQSDDDWYIVYLDPGEERLKTDLIFSHAAGNIDMEIWYWNGSFTYLTGSNSFDDNEYIDIIVPWSGNYYIKIFGDNSGNIYDLWWEDLMLSGDDWMEENDDFGGAWYVDPNYYSGLKMVYNDDDWFKTYLRNGDNFEVSIFFKHFEGDLELELYDPSGAHRVGSYSSNDDEKITYMADMAGDWRIRVYHAVGTSELHYDLDIWVNAGGSPDDDWMEENDGFWSAWYIDPSYYPGLILDHSDEDWFMINLADGDVLDVRIFYNDYQGNLELELYSPSNTFKAGSYSDNYDEFISFIIDQTGEWRIRVYHADEDSRVDYDLDIWIKDDFYEFNNYPQDIYKDHPSVLAEDEHTWLSDLHGLAVQEDHDWYIIDITPGFEHLVLELSFNHSLGNIDVGIYDEWGTFIIGNTSMTNDEHINYVVPHPGLYAIHVNGSNMRNKYDMWWDDLRTDWRSDDNYEMNNDAMTAYDISFLENGSIWEWDGLALQYDQDWYEIYIMEPGLQLIVALMYDSAEGLMGFEVYDSDLHKIASNFTLTDNDYIIQEVTNGTYYIRVFGDNSGNVYNLWWGTQKPDEVGMIPGYDILILIASIVGISTVVIKKKRSKFTQK